MEYDIHLSSEQISRNTILELEKLGFKRDEFANNRRCEATAFHASYDRELSNPDNVLWSTLVNLLSSDKNFRGCLEEEVFMSTSRNMISGSDLKVNYECLPFELNTVKIGRHKECDIHMSIDFNKSRDEAIQEIEKMGMISFDRPAK